MANQKPPFSTTPVTMAAAIEETYFQVSWSGISSLDGPSKVFLRASTAESIGTALSRVLPKENLVVCALNATTYRVIYFRDR